MVGIAEEQPSLSGAIEDTTELFINAPHVPQIAAAASFDDVSTLEGRVAVYDQNRKTS